MMLMVGASLLLNVQLAECKMLTERGLPDFLLISMAMAVQGLCVLAWAAVARPMLPEKGSCKWLLAAGLFFAGSFTAMVLAVRVGLPLGDFAALNSSNIVFATFMGRAFLGERLHWAHSIAVVSSFAGALLIAKPEFLFGSKEGASDEAWLGAALALASGFCDAGIYICARKTEAASPVWLVATFSLFGTVSSFAVAALQDGGLPLAVIVAEPLMAAGWTMVLFVTGFVGIVLFTCAAQWCPAAASATIDTATRMISGYAAQMVLFAASLNVLTLAGAACMFLSVAIMALMQPQADSNVSDNAASDIAEVVEAGVAAPPLTGEDDDNESLASFIASEFASPAPREPRSMPLRMRRSRVGGEPVAKTIGSLAAASVAASA